jgi:hypothetical protein
MATKIDSNKRAKTITIKADAGIKLKLVPLRKPKKSKKSKK